MIERDWGIMHRLCPYRLHRLGTHEYVCDRLLVTTSQEVVCIEDVCPMRPYEPEDNDNDGDPD